MSGGTWRESAFGANEGSINTFPANQTAAPGRDGRPGGNVIIRAKLGKGILYMQARGENGGEGPRGKRGATGPKGPRGNDGRCETGWGMNKSFFDWFTLIPEAYAGRDRDVTDRPDPRRRVTYCAVQTGNGGPGGRGFPGESGAPGGRGGDSAKVYVRVEDATQLLVKPSALPGAGGVGGRGGPGGWGGVGGDPGNPTCAACPAAKEGDYGPIGPPGGQGPNGPTGKEAPICLRLGTGVFGDCPRE